MSGKTHDSPTLADHSEADDLRLIVKELNQSVTYLSKMVLQLQRSLGNKQGKAPATTEKPETLH